MVNRMNGIDGRIIPTLNGLKKYDNAKGNWGHAGRPGHRGGSAPSGSSIEDKVRRAAEENTDLYKRTRDVDKAEKVLREREETLTSLTKLSEGITQEKWAESGAKTFADTAKNYEQDIMDYAQKRTALLYGDKGEVIRESYGTRFQVGRTDLDNLRGYTYTTPTEAKTAQQGYIRALKDSQGTKLAALKRNTDGSYDIIQLGTPDMGLSSDTHFHKFEYAEAFKDGYNMGSEALKRTLDDYRTHGLN